MGIEVLCENTNLASMSIGLNNLATFKLPIEKLTISKCNIGKFYFVHIVVITTKGKEFYQTATEIDHNVKLTSSPRNRDEISDVLEFFYF